MRQLWIEEALQSAVQVSPLQPRRHGVGSLLVSVAAFLWEDSVIETAEAVQLYVPRTASL
jgi:hypothetical protein